MAGKANPRLLRKIGFETERFRQTAGFLTEAVQELLVDKLCLPDA